MSDASGDALRAYLKGATENPEEVPVSEVREYLDHDDATTREMAVDVFAELANSQPDRVRQVIPSLCDRLEDDSDMVRRNASRFFLVTARAEPSSILEVLSEVFATLDDPDGFVRKNGAVTVRYVAEANPAAVVDAVELVGPLLSDDSELTKVAAAEILGFVVEEQPSAVDPAIGSLLEAMGNTYDDESLVDLPEEVADDPRVEGAFTEIKENQKHDMHRRFRTRRVAGSVLTSLIADHPEIVLDSIRVDLEILSSLVSDPIPEVRTATVGILAYAAERDPAVIGPVAEDLLDCLEDDEPAVRGNAAWALSYLDDPEIRAALRAHEDDDQNLQSHIRELGAQ